MESVEELREFLARAVADNAWGRLLDRGTAWSIMRQAGQLPADAPAFGNAIEHDLAEYGFALLRAALALRERDQETTLASDAFEKSARAFEAIVRNGPPDATERGFYRVLAGASYHLAGYSAVAYSLFNEHAADENVSPGEYAVIQLVLRDLGSLRSYTKHRMLNESNQDRFLAVNLERGDIEENDVIANILNSTICRALSFFDFALQTGDSTLRDEAERMLGLGVDIAKFGGNVPLWWVCRLCQHLITDLWSHSLHQLLPTDSPTGGEENYPPLRELFLAQLYSRKIAEVEVWPSQREAALRAGDVHDDLVVSLPTSAGKTRVAELATLMTLSLQQRVLIVTPLRALSAQTERSFRKLFSPLGFSVSSLYGASGASLVDQDALRGRDIVIATPEKLDFALRSDQDLINDIGLIVLDEGHMIGPSDREIRYEMLVQRLLRRADADKRRIVCLSAVLPDGEELEDLTAWIRSDVAGEPVLSDWRPTRQRFGYLTWRGSHAKLNFDLDDNGPYLRRFVEQIPAKGRQRKPYPRDNKDLTLFAAWRFVDQGKRVLIYVTQANWVESYARVAVDLVEREYLPTLLDDQNAIHRAVTIGQEWLGDDHPVVQALKIGIAIHYAGLPNPFLREVEQLLSTGVIKVTVASPTLTQGLNINAAVLLIPTLHRAGQTISGEEFANVAGRAGRAFVDVEGLVVHVMHDAADWRLDTWREIVASAKCRSLQSGLVLVIGAIIERLSRSGTLDRDDAFEYLANSREAWSDEEDVILDDADEDLVPLNQLVEKLDAVVFGLVDALDADRADLPALLDEALQGSLWERQIVRDSNEEKTLHRQLLRARAYLIWAVTTVDVRKGHFAMGLGLESGLLIDEMADELSTLIDVADGASLTGDTEELSTTLVQLARKLLVLPPFVPDKKNKLPDDWESLLTVWVAGTDVSVIGSTKMHIVEDAFCYRLVWALEALRVRRLMLGWSPELIPGGAAASLETGVPQFMMSLLIRSGLPSRRAAMAAINQGDAAFVDLAGMRHWIRSDEIAELTETGEWPTQDTAELWVTFRNDMLQASTPKWRTSCDSIGLDLDSDVDKPPSGMYRIEVDENTHDVWLCTPDHQPVVQLKSRLRDSKGGLYAAEISSDTDKAQVRRIGPGRPIWSV